MIVKIDVKIMCVFVAVVVGDGGLGSVWGGKRPLKKKSLVK